MKGRAISWSAEELAWVKQNSQRPRAEAHADFVRLFGRLDVKLSNFHSLCKRRGWMTGRSGQFSKGAAPHNKGKPCLPGKGGRHPNARKTQFRKGERRGVAARLYKPIGTERISKDGYLERKIHDGLPLQSRWRAVHLIEWEEANGHLPKGHALKCLDGDKTNTDPANWLCVPRALLPRLNGGAHRQHLAYDQADPELRPTILAVAQVEHAARKAIRKSVEGERAS